MKALLPLVLAAGLTALSAAQPVAAQTAPGLQFRATRADLSQQQFEYAKHLCVLAGLSQITGQNPNPAAAFLPTTLLCMQQYGWTAAPQ